MFIQPFFDSQIEEISPPDLARALGFDVITDENGIDEDSLLGALYNCDMEEGLSYWNPEIPEGYMLGGKYESDDGPFAFFVKPNSGVSLIIRMQPIGDDEINLISFREPTQKEREYGESLVDLADKYLK